MRQSFRRVLLMTSVMVVSAVALTGCAALVGGAAGGVAGYVAGHHAGEEEAEEEIRDHEHRDDDHRT